MPSRSIPTRGSFILVAADALHRRGADPVRAAHRPRSSEGAPFDPVSREGALVANNLFLLSVILGIVLVGTLYPLHRRGRDGREIVGRPALFQRRRRAARADPRRADADRPAAALAARLAAPVAAAARVPAWSIALATLVATLLLAPSIGLLAAPRPRARRRPGPGQPRAACSAARCAARRSPSGACASPISGSRWRSIGMASDSAFTREKLATAVPGERSQVGPWLVELRDVVPVAGPNWTALEAELRASRGGGVIVLKPQSRFFTEPATTTSEAAIETDWNGQLYAVLGAQDAATGRWQVRLWWKPFVTLIWFGGVLIALGGAARADRPLVARARAPGAASRRPSGEARASLPSAGRARCCSSARWRGAWRCRVTTASPRGSTGRNVPAFALPPALAGQARAGLGRPRHAASRAWSTSSPAGACRASPKRRC